MSKTIPKRQKIEVEKHRILARPTFKAICKECGTLEKQTLVGPLILKTDTEFDNLPGIADKLD